MLARPSWLAAASACSRVQLRRWKLASKSVPFPAADRQRRCLARCPNLQRKIETENETENEMGKEGRLPPATDTTLSSKEVCERKDELDRARIEPYPRVQPIDSPSRVPVTVAAWLHPHSGVDEAEHGQGKTATATATACAGRITAIRSSGKKLVFYDLRTDTATVQVKLNYGSLAAPKPSLDEFQRLCRLLRRGDHILVRAVASSTRDGKPALEAVCLPVLQSPCLQRLPVAADGPAAAAPGQATDRHVDMLTSLDAVRMVKTRHMLVQGIRQFLTEQGFIEVQTPILAGQAGGAIARAFETSATEFPERRLSLRIAPELWLKRLVIGGLSRVFEIGPSFRNEGLDKTHNPEFTTCEFYAAYWTLEKLKAATEQLLATVPWNALHLDPHTAADDVGLIDFDLARQLSPNTAPWIWQEYVDVDGGRHAEGSTEASVPVPAAFPSIDFIPALNSSLGLALPDLASPTARTEILAIFERRQMPIPDRPTLPRLLDELSSQLLEPQCHGPTWIEQTPACLSPLAKSFIHPTAPNGQLVAARAELFVRGKEVVNCYEEENDPFEQRRKMMEQQRHGRGGGGGGDDEAMKVDQEYIRAMEWGLPPTGGWGMGIDRLLMLLTGRERIADVLTFGNLRAVTRGSERAGSGSCRI